MQINMRLDIWRRENPQESGNDHEAKNKKREQNNKDSDDHENWTGNESNIEVEAPDGNEKCREDRGERSHDRTKIEGKENRTEPHTDHETQDKTKRKQKWTHSNSVYGRSVRDAGLTPFPLTIKTLL